MKTIKLFSVLIATLFATTIYAQEIPKKEFTISIAEKNIQLLPGETKEISVTLNRSKSYSKTKITLAMGSTLPEGISVIFEDGTNPLNERVMIINSAFETSPFQKTMILKAKSSRSTKAIMMNVSLDTQSLSSN
ncbi:MAG: hypothetical protein JXR07_05095 [Reichenbachiella sp.]